MNKRTRKNAENGQLNKRLMLQTLRGYARADKFIEAEKRAWLSHMTPEESWNLFDALYRSWEFMGKRSGENWDVLEQRRLADKVAFRRIFDRLAKKMQHKR